MQSIRGGHVMPREANQKLSSTQRDTNYETKSESNRL